MNSELPSILVVDDEKDTCANLQDILGDLGFEVDVAYNGPAALELVKEKSYDVALLDLKMPGMDGLELYRRIKKLQTGTVAIIVTAYAAGDTTQEAQKAGAWQVLSKPVEFPRLLRLIEEVSEQPMLLIIDDDSDLCDSLWDLFRERGYRVYMAHSAAEGEQRLRDRQCDVVLVDIKLPDSRAGEAFRTVRHVCPDARTVVITGYRSEMERTIDQVVGEGADAVCYKPFDVRQLLETVQGLARREAGK
jgi:two-component system, NtrC family, response regulator HydG